MALKAILSKEGFEALGTDFKAEYKTDGDRYVLDVDPVDGWNLEDVTGLKTALETERSSHTAMEGLLHQFGAKEKKNAEGGKTGKWELGDWVPSELKKKINKLAELEKIDVKTEAGKLAEVQVEAIREQLATQNEKAIHEKDDRIDFLQNHLYDAKVVSEITEALADKDVKGNSALLMHKMKEHVKLKETDGKFKVQVVDVNGVAKVNAKADPMTPKEFALELKADDRFKGAFEGSGHTGSGPTPDGDAKPKPGDAGTGTSRIAAGLRDPSTVSGAAGSNG